MEMSLEWAFEDYTGFIIRLFNYIIYLTLSYIKYLLEENTPD